MPEATLEKELQQKGMEKHQDSYQEERGSRGRNVPVKGSRAAQLQPAPPLPCGCNVPLRVQHPAGSLQPHGPTRLLCSRGHVLAVLLPFIKRSC